MQQIDFHLRGEFVELNQLLKLAGVCDSGGAGKALVAEGLVSVVVGCACAPDVYGKIVGAQAHPT